MSENFAACAHMPGYSRIWRFASDPVSSMEYHWP